MCSEQGNIRKRGGRSSYKESSRVRPKHQESQAGAKGFGLPDIHPTISKEANSKEEDEGRVGKKVASTCARENVLPICA
jgi:hypothetical protein